MSQDGYDKSEYYTDIDSGTEEISSSSGSHYFHSDHGKDSESQKLISQITEPHKTVSPVPELAFMHTPRSRVMKKERSIIAIITLLALLIMSILADRAMNPPAKDVTPYITSTVGELEDKFYLQFRSVDASNVINGPVPVFTDNVDVTFAASNNLYIILFNGEKRGIFIPTRRWKLFGLEAGEKADDADSRLSYSYDRTITLDGMGNDGNDTYHIYVSDIYGTALIVTENILSGNIKGLTFYNDSSEALRNLR